MLQMRREMLFFLQKRFMVSGFYEIFSAIRVTAT